MILRVGDDNIRDTSNMMKREWYKIYENLNFVRQSYYTTYYQIDLYFALLPYNYRLQFLFSNESQFSV